MVLSIMLSSSIHAVAKGTSSFFLSAAYNSIVKIYHCILLHFMILLYKILINILMMDI